MNESQSLHTEEEYHDIAVRNRVLSELVFDCVMYYKKLDVDRLEKFRRKCKKAVPRRLRYPFIPLSIEIVLRDLMFLKKKFQYGATFIDAGCGIGWVVNLAKACGFNATGVEIEPENVDIAKKVFNADVRQGDILEWDFSKYDIIYYYWPIIDEKLQKKFENHVEDQMKVGAVLVPHMKRDRKIEKDKRFEHEGYVGNNNIWKKVRKLEE